MLNTSIVKEFTWDMAHILAGHMGNCRNLHGHTYKLQVEVTNGLGKKVKLENQSEIGMVMDFSNLKKVINEVIIEPLDHSFIYWKNSIDVLEHDIAKLLKKHNRKVVEVEYRPTVEEMAQSFMKDLNQEFIKYNIKVVSVKLWETPTSFAKITGGY